MPRPRTHALARTLVALGLAVLALAGLAAMVASVAALWIGARLSLDAVLASRAFLAGVVVLLAAYVVALAASRRARGATLAAVSVAAMIAIALCLSLDAWKYSPERFDASFGKVNRLSDQTFRVLAALPDDVTVTTYLVPRDDEETLRMRRVEELLDEYARAAAGRIVTRHLGTADPEAVRLAMRRMGLYRLEADTVIFTTDARAARRMRKIAYRDMFQKARPGAYLTTRPAFRGEEAITGALLALARPDKRAHFLAGHGERSITSDDDQGYAPLVAYLRRNGFDVAATPLQLAGDAPVPEDCEILVIAGPKSRIAGEELRAIGTYLAAGGKALVMIDPLTRDTGLRRFLVKYDVAVGDDLVADRKRNVGGPYNPVVSTYPPHAITAPLENAYTAVYLARSVQVNPAREPDSPWQVAVILATDEAGWAEGDVDALLQGTTPEYDDATDRRGPVGLAVAVERAGADADGVIGAKVQTRLVVVGDADFADAEGLQRMDSNHAFVLNVMNWLRGEDRLITIPSKSVVEAWLSMKSADEKRVGLLLVVGLPIAVIACGAVILVFRAATGARAKR